MSLMTETDGLLSQQVRLLDVYTVALRTQQEVADMKEALLTGSAARLPDQEQRLRRLENFRYVLMGGGLGSGVVSSWLVHLLMAHGH